MYVTCHAWNAMLALTFAFAWRCCRSSAATPSGTRRWRAALEVGVTLSALLCMRAPFWAKRPGASGGTGTRG